MSVAINESGRMDIQAHKVCAQNSNSVEVNTYLIIDRNPFSCDTIDDWYKEGVDFTITAMEPATLDVNRDDVEGDTALTQTQANNLTWSETASIAAKYGSRFLQRIQAINADEIAKGRQGEGIIAYAEGHFHFVQEWVYNKDTEDEYIVQIVQSNLKLTNWISPFVGKLESDTAYDLGWNVENWPAYRFMGKVPPEFLPEGIEAPTFEYTTAGLTDTELTISGVVVEDNAGVVSPEVLLPVNLRVTNAVTNELIVEQAFEFADTEYVITGNFTDVEEVNVFITYSISETMSLPWAAINAEKVVVVG